MTQDKVYVGQVLQITLDTEVDLSDSLNPQILAISPMGIEKVWDGTVVGTTIKYTTVKDTDLDYHGTWKLQALPNIEGAEALGETVSLLVNRKGY